jgi:hypothetical protein
MNAANPPKRLQRLRRVLTTANAKGLPMAMHVHATNPRPNQPENVRQARLWRRWLRLDLSPQDEAIVFGQRLNLRRTQARDPIQA